jgi:hypothetical protein
LRENDIDAPIGSIEPLREWVAAAVMVAGREEAPRIVVCISMARLL